MKKYFLTLILILFSFNIFADEINNLDYYPHHLTCANRSFALTLKSKLDKFPDIPAYEATNARIASFPYFNSATISSGTATFQLTTDGKVNGTAIFPNGIITSSIRITFNDSLNSYQSSYVLSNGNKTLTITANKTTTVSLLTGIIGQTPANNVIVNIQIWGY